MNVPLLTDTRDESGPMGIVFEKSPSAASRTFAFSTPSIVVLLEAGHCEITVPALRVAESLESSELCLFPRATPFSLESRGGLLNLCILLPASELFDTISSAFDIPPEAARAVFAHQTRLPMTVWLREIFHRYVFERIVCRKRDNLVTRFLEAEVVKELYYVSQDAQSKTRRKHFLRSGDPALQKAIEHIDANLNRRIRLEELAELCGKSASSLQRMFTKEFGMAPYQYIQARRLDEAFQLLKTGRYTVGTVAALVGYDDLPSFTQAFKAKFGCVPSSLLGEGG